MIYYADSKIGSGVYSDVYSGIYKIDAVTPNGERVAIKEYRNYNEKIAKMIRAEIAILTTIKHPNIVKLIDYQINIETVVLILELCDYTLTQYVNSTKYGITPIVLRPMVNQIVEALRYIHECGIVHRDIKSDNILLIKRSETYLEVKIIDFGFSKKYVESFDVDVNTVDIDIMHQSICGTPIYMAPEILNRINGNEIESNYDSKIDVWAFGIMLYYMITKRVPYLAKDIKELGHKHRETVVMSPMNCTDAVISEILMSSLIINPIDRPTFNDIHNKLHNASQTAIIDIPIIPGVTNDGSMSPNNVSNGSMSPNNVSNTSNGSISPNNVSNGSNGSISPSNAPIKREQTFEQIISIITTAEQAIKDQRTTLPELKRSYTIEACALLWHCIKELKQLKQNKNDIEGATLTLINRCEASLSELSVSNARYLKDYKGNVNVYNILFENAKSCSKNGAYEESQSRYNTAEKLYRKAINLLESITVYTSPYCEDIKMNAICTEMIKLIRDRLQYTLQYTSM
jgi:serine/threonine protein kinase